MKNNDGFRSPGVSYDNEWHCRGCNAFHPASESRRLQHPGGGVHCEQYAYKEAMRGR